MADLATSSQSINVTIDDFDALWTYSDDAAFNTNDPSRNEAAFAQFWDHTAHFTSNTSAYVNLSFVGSGIALYGASGPSYGSYQVELNGQVTDATAYATENGTLPHLLYSSSGLNASQPHSLVLRNLGDNGNSTQGSQMLLDFATLTVPVAPEGATLTNTTVEDNSDRLVYTGVWDSNSSPSFSGGTTSYTNATGASVQLTFNGTAIYVFGDANNDHYAFNVTLDGVTTTHHTPLGCGGPFEPHACEKILPGLQYFAGPLNDSQHTITVTNYVVPSLNYSYFDLDRFVYTTPSTYLDLPQAANVPAQNGGQSSNGVADNGNSNATGGAMASTHANGLLALATLAVPSILALF